MNNNVDRKDEGLAFELIMVIVVFLGLIIVPLFNAMGDDNSEYLAESKARRERIDAMVDKMWVDMAEAYVEVYGEETTAE